MCQLTTMKVKKDVRLTDKPFNGYYLIFFIILFISIFTSTNRADNAPGFSPSLSYTESARYLKNFKFKSLRLAITDLIETFGDSYPKGQYYLLTLDNLEKSSKAVLDPLDKSDYSGRKDVIKLAKNLNKLRYDSLLSNPLLDFEKLLLLKRKRGQLGLPVNHKCNTGIEKIGYDNEISILTPVHATGNLITLFRPSKGRFVGEIDLHYDAQKLLFTMPKGKAGKFLRLIPMAAVLDKSHAGKNNKM